MTWFQKKEKKQKRKITDREAVRFAYKGKAIATREVGKKEAYIERNKQIIDEYVGNGMREDALPLAQQVARAENDKKRWLKKRLLYDRLIGEVEARVGGTNMEEVDDGLRSWIRESKHRNSCTNNTAELIDGLNELEGEGSEQDYVVDQIHGERSQYSDRAEAILQEIQTKVNTRRRQAHAMQEEAEGEETQEAMPV